MVEYTKMKAAGWRIGSERRPGMVRKGHESLPGPAVYKIPSKIVENQKYSLSPKLSIDYKVKNDKLVPGPGSYEFHCKAMKTAPNYGIGTSKRTGNSPNPGMKGVSTDPGAYNPKNTFTKLQSP